jgi:hypothetical protein
MSDTHYYYALNRKAAERIVRLTWNQFLDRFGWRRSGQWQNIGGYLAFALDRPELPEEPDSEEIAPILRQTIRETIPQMSPQYFCLLELSYHLRHQSFVRVDLNAEGLEADCDALIACALRAFLSGGIDDETLWCVLTLHGEPASDFSARFDLTLPSDEQRRVRDLKKRFGRCRPLFKWQTMKAVRDGHNVLNEEETRRFARFIRLAWGRNWPVFCEQKPMNFRHFELARRLYSVSDTLPGSCLIRYLGP